MTATPIKAEICELILPWVSPPLSLNDRRNRWAHARKVAEVRQAAFVLAKHAHLGPYGRVQVALHYRPRDRRIRDTENPTPTLKACCDGLVSAKVVIDDDPAHMVKLMPIIHEPSSASGPRLWLTVQETGPVTRLDLAESATAREQRDEQ